MIQKTTSAYTSYNSFAFICAGVLTFAWVMTAQKIFIDTDTGWLLLCLQRFLNGGTYAKDFFETNPPLSFLIYLPVIPFIDNDPQSLKLSLILIFLGYALFADFIILLLLRKTNLPDHLKTLILISLLFSQTWPMGIFSISRDALVFYFLAPLCLTQYLLTEEKIKFSPLSFIASLLGGVAICLKPHYALIPLGFFLHRLYKTKKIRTILFAPDFIIMLLTGICYGLFVITFFPDYISIVLPQVISIYYSTPALPLLNMAYFLFFTLFAALIGGFVDKHNPQKKEIDTIINITLVISLTCFISYYMQGKGFLYQTLPFIGFTAFAFFFASASLLSQHIARKYLSVWITYSALMLLCLPQLTGFTGSPIPTHEKFRNIEFFKKIDTIAREGSYISYDFKPHYLALPYYYNVQNVSRFGILWPFDGLNYAHNAAQTDQEKTDIREKFKFFIDILAEDIALHSPNVILIPRYARDDNSPPEQTLLPLLLKNTNYAKAFEKYELSEEIIFDPAPFLPKKNKDEVTAITFDVYKIKS